MKPYLLVFLIALVSAGNSEEGDKNAEEPISEKSDSHDNLGLAENPYVSGLAGVKIPYYPAAAKNPLYLAAKPAAKLPYYPAAYTCRV